MVYYVAYYRVSTRKQERSGLGLEAQKDTVKRFCSDGKIVSEFVEIESGKKNDRPKLAEAILFSKSHNTKLVIAKLDRLSRNAAFIFSLRDSGVDFVCCDLPDANTLTIGIFATLAQHERELISKRTKEALAAKKAQGFKLGSPQNLTEKSRIRSLEVRRARAGQKWRYSKPRVIAMEERRKGKSLRTIAKFLNEMGYKSALGKNFQAMTVLRLLK